MISLKIRNLYELWKSISKREEKELKEGYVKRVS